jgi:hypothetical protein
MHQRHRWSIVRRHLARVRARTAKVVAFDAHDWRVLAEVMVTLITIQMALHVVKFPRLLAWATRARPRRGVQWPPESIARIAWLVDAGGRLMRRRCLTRSLTLARLLAQRGLTVDVRIGVRRDADRLEAHAWVECMGDALNERPRQLQTFAAFDRLIGGSPNV